jgi:hypothetical protein
MMTLHYTESGQSLGTINAHPQGPIERNAGWLKTSCLATSTLRRFVTRQ